MSFREYNFDGLVGPTHNYAGLAAGNLASEAHKGLVSRPRAAARQGLAKMRALHRLGVPQALLPPLERPAVSLLRHAGFSGDDATVLAQAAQQAPRFLVAACSASSMWTANAATVTPSPDAGDGRLHLTPANLESNLHRAIEGTETTAVLRRVFADEGHFCVHAPLAGGSALRDEGAANHTRLTPAFDQPGLHLFVFGIDESAAEPGPVRFPARQTRLASETIARRHRLPEANRLFLQQAPAAIDAGVFHHDVIGVGHRDVFFCHADAFARGEAAFAEIIQRFQSLTGADLRVLRVEAADVPVDLAVKTYLFNSQLVTLPNGETLLVAPSECEDNPTVKAYLDAQLASSASPLDAVRFFNLRESMRNGGGPACLRQRTVLSEAQAAALKGRVVVDEPLLDALEAWVDRHYREALSPSDLADPQLLAESRAALDALTDLLELPALYAFQS